MINPKIAACDLGSWGWRFQTFPSPSLQKYSLSNRSLVQFNHPSTIHLFPLSFFLFLPNPSKYHHYKSPIALLNPENTQRPGFVSIRSRNGLKVAGMDSTEGKGGLRGWREQEYAHLSLSHNSHFFTTSFPNKIFSSLLFPIPLHLILQTSSHPNHPITLPNHENTQRPGSVSIRASSGLKVAGIYRTEGKGGIKR